MHVTSSKNLKFRNFRAIFNYYPLFLQNMKFFCQQTQTVLLLRKEHADEKVVFET